MALEAQGFEASPQGHVWTVSSRCNNGSCVAVTTLPSGHIGVRDTKASSGPILSFTTDEWSTFITAIKDARQ